MTAPRVFILLVAVSATAVLGWIALRGPASPVEPTTLDEPVVVPVREGSFDAAFDVTIAPEYGVPPRLFSPVGGLVTSVAAAPGATLAGGDPVLGIDNMLRLAYVADEPLARPLTTGDDGPQVEDLQRYLVDLGLLNGVDGEFGRATREAVREFNESIGVTGAARSTFDPARVVWIGPGGFEVTTVQVVPGTAVAAGEQLAAGPVPVVDATIDEPDDAPGRRDQSWVLELDDTVVPYPRGGDPVTDDLLAALSSTDPPEEGEVIRAEARFAEPQQVAIVPASSVLEDDAGQRCVVVPRDGGFETVAIDVVGGGLGVVEIDPIDGLTEVVANPTMAGLETTCD